MPRPLAALALFALSAQAAAQDSPVGGIGNLACREITGAENAPYLAQAGDWALGYLAGRLDAGQEPADGAALSPDAGFDAITGIVLRCRQRPDMAVIDAVRAYAGRIFDEAPQAGPVSPVAMGDSDADIAGAVPRPKPRPSGRD